MKVTNIEQEALVTECRTSGMKAKTWCEAKGIEYRRYVSWATRVNRNRLKALNWDRNGFVLYYKRLDGAVYRNKPKQSNPRRYVSSN